MTVQETAAALQVSRMTVLRMMDDGRLTNVAPILPARKRQPIRFARAQVDALRPRPRTANDAPPPPQPRKSRHTAEYLVTTYTPPVVANVERLLHTVDPPAPYAARED